jgi:hypothetical protein
MRPQPCSWLSAAATPAPAKDVGHVHRPARAEGSVRHRDPRGRGRVGPRASSTQRAAAPTPDPGRPATRCSCSSIRTACGRGCSDRGITTSSDRESVSVGSRWRYRTNSPSSRIVWRRSGWRSATEASMWPFTPTLDRRAGIDAIDFRLLFQRNVAPKPGVARGIPSSSLRRRSRRRSRTRRTTCPVRASTARVYTSPFLARVPDARASRACPVTGCPRIRNVMDSTQRAPGARERAAGPSDRQGSSGPRHSAQTDAFCRMTNLARRPDC